MEKKDIKRNMVAAAPLKAVMSPVPPEILEWRRRTGADRWDESWEGVVHMGPSPNIEHQDLQFALESFLRRSLKERRIRVLHDINLASPGGWPRDFRIPDLVLFGPGNLLADRMEYLEGAPDAVVEIESPGDETREKLAFYAGIGVPEVWIVDRDTKEPEVLVLKGAAYEAAPRDPAGWTSSPLAGIEMRAREGKLAVRLRGDDATLELLPED